MKPALVTIQSAGYWIFSILYWPIRACVIYLLPSFLAATHVYTARKPLWHPKTLVSQLTDPANNTLGRWNEIQWGRESSHTISNVIGPQLRSSELVLRFNVILEKQITNTFSYRQFTSRMTSILTRNLTEF